MKKLLHIGALIICISSIILVSSYSLLAHSYRLKKVKFENTFHVRYPDTEERHLLAISTVDRCLADLKKSLEQREQEAIAKFKEIKLFPDTSIEDEFEQGRQVAVVHEYQDKIISLKYAVDDYHTAIDIAYDAGFHEEAIAHGYNVIVRDFP